MENFTHEEIVVLDRILNKMKANCRASVSGNVCPHCDSTDTIPIVYGSPSKEMCEGADAGLHKLGGCCMYKENPSHHCNSCNKGFGNVKL